MALIVGAGWAKGMRLEAPAGESTRPTSAKVRAAVLNSLATRLENARLLDVFAGSGAWGIEALSRGAAACAFVEVATAPARCLGHNLAALARRAAAQQLAEPDVWVIRRDAAAAVAELARGVERQQAPFDIIFVDPPYAEAAAWVKKLALDLDRLAAPDAELWIETAARTVLADAAGAALGESAWRLVRTRAYGDTLLHVFHKEPQAGTPELSD